MKKNGATHTDKKSNLVDDVHENVQKHSSTIDTLVKPVTDMLEKVYKALPPLPTGISNFFGSYLSWIALIFGAVGLITSLSNLININSLLNPTSLLGSELSGFAERYLGNLAKPTPMQQFSIILGVVWGLINSLILLLAYKPLQEKKMYGWKLLYWNFLASTLVNLVTTLLTGFSGLFGFVIGFAIFGTLGIWFLFGSKSHFKK